MGNNRKDCPLYSKGYCRACGAFCWDVDDEKCDIAIKAYQLGYDAGYKEADALNYYEGSSIGGFHDY